MEDPIYLIKSRSGDTLIQGTAEQVSAWIKQRRVTDKDELKRQGWYLYEKDEAWGVVSAFPEFSGPAAHSSLRTIRRQNLWMLSVAAVFGLLGFSLLTLNFLMPAYDASKRIEASIDAERQAVMRMQEVLASKQKAEAEAKAAYAEAARQEALARQADANLEAQVKRTAMIQAEIWKLNAQAEQVRSTMPIVVRWRDSLINSDKFLVVTNTSDKVLRLLVSVYDAKGVQTTQQFPLTLEPVGLPGSTKESGVGEAIKHDFKKAESAEFTDVDSSKFVRFRPVRLPCP
jgi:hypothetical protein